MGKLGDYRLRLGKDELLPLLVGGMGVDISTSDLALEIARLGGVGHISDAMAPWVCDKKFGTNYQKEKYKKYQQYRDTMDKSKVKWDLVQLYEAGRRHVSETMAAKKGSGCVFINVMEKLAMGGLRETLRARLRGALDGGIDGITLSAGLHTGTFKLIEDHPRFRDAYLGIIVSSARALKLFLRSAGRVRRLPDYIIVEGPLAGGHLGFGLDWKKWNLKNIVEDVQKLLQENGHNIPVIPAGGVFTGSDAAEFLEQGVGAVQVATRFTIARETGLPPKVKQEYLRASEQDIEVNMVSPTGYAMRMLKSSPCLRSNIKPSCELLGYILDSEGKCSYQDAWERTGFDEKGRKLPVTDKMCICYHFMKYNCYTCGHYVYRLKDTTVKLENGEYYCPSAEHIFNDYMNSKEHSIDIAEPVQTVKEKKARLA